MSASAASGLESMGRSEAPHFAALHESENGPERTCRSFDVRFPGAG